MVTLISEHGWDVVNELGIMLGLSAVACVYFWRRPPSKDE